MSVAWCGSGECGGRGRGEGGEEILGASYLEEAKEGSWVWCGVVRYIT